MPGGLSMGHNREGRLMGDRIIPCRLCGERFKSSDFISHFKDATEPRPASKSNCHSTHYLREQGYIQSKTGYWLKP